MLAFCIGTVIVVVFVGVKAMCNVSFAADSRAKNQEWQVRQ